MTGSWWQTEETTHLASACCLGSRFHFVLWRCYFAIFATQRWGFSINNSSCFLPLLWLCFLWRSALSWGGSHFSSSSFYHAIILSMPCSNFLLHPVITVHHWGRSRPLNVGGVTVRVTVRFSIFATPCDAFTVLSFGSCFQLWSLCLSISLFLLFFCPVSLFSLSLFCFPTLFPLLCSVSLIWSPWFSLPECLFVWWVSHSSLWGYETFWSCTRGECLQLQYTSLWLRSAHSVAYTSATVLCELCWGIKEMQTRLPSRHTAHFISVHTPQTGQSMLAIASFTQFQGCFNIHTCELHPRICPIWACSYEAGHEEAGNRWHY